MRPPSIRRRLMIWVLSALSVGALVLVLTAYWLTLGEIDEVLDDSLRQTGLLLADRDLAGVLPAQPVARLVPSADTESQLVAIARTPDGMLLFTSAPELSLRFDATPELSSQRVNEAQWRVFTVVHADRITQVAQPISVRQGVAAESASQLLLPLFVLITLIGAMLLVALRRGMDPLRLTSEALARRSASSLTPLEVQGVPMELLPLMRTLNDLLHRLSQAFEAQRHFVADAAHELRSPLTALQLQIQVLERSRGPAERAEATTELLAGVARARRLVEQLLYLSRASAGDNAGVPLVREPVTLRDVAQAVVARWSLEAEHRHIDLGVDAESESSVDVSRAQ